MVTTLDAVLEAFRPPDRERDRDKRPAPPDDHEDFADRDRDQIRRDRLVHLEGKSAAVAVAYRIADLGRRHHRG